MVGQCCKSKSFRVDKRYFNEDLIKNYNEEIDEGYFLEVDIQYLEKLSQWSTIFTRKNENKKLEKLVANLYDKTEYVILKGI